MKGLSKSLRVLLLAGMIVVACSTYSQAMMGNPGFTGMMPGGSGIIGGNMMNSSGGFGMMNGMTGAPVVGDDGTAYLVIYTPTADTGTVPNSNSFQSTIVAYTPDGEASSITLKGIVSRPVVTANTLVATASLPDFQNYTMFGNYGTNSANNQSVLYVLTAPFSAATVPLAVSMDGSFASSPVIANNHVYVTTSDFGNAMMNNMANWMYGNYNFNSTGTAKTYLYIFNLDGTLSSKITVQ